jgi:hypothetical protein
VVHEFASLQFNGEPPTHAPVWQASFCVQMLPSLHAVPFAAGGFEQMPVAGLQDPAAWHWSLAEQTTGLDPTQAPS